jgi:hypothetical protein
VSFLVHINHLTSFYVTPQEFDVIACHTNQILNSGPAQPSSSPYAPPPFLIPKQFFVPVLSTRMLCTPREVPTYYNTFPRNSSFSKQILEKASEKFFFL